MEEGSLRAGGATVAVSLTGAVAAAVLAIGVGLATPAAATAAEAPPPLFWQVPIDGEAGSGAGQLLRPRGLAVDPASGHVYVADLSNARISEFSAWGAFVKAWGWGVADGAAEPQACGPEAGPPTGACGQGLKGSGAGQFGGQFGGPRSLAVDSSGDVYAYEVGNFRVQKFSSDGEFLLMFGGGVNQTTGGDVCSKADLEGGDLCGAGAKGSGDGQFSTNPFVGTDNNLAVSPTDTVYVGAKDRIQEFDAGGSYLGSVALPEEGYARSLAVDSSGVLYFAYDYDIGVETPTQPDIYRQSGGGWEVFAKVPFPQALAVDSEDNLYAINIDKLSSPRKLEIVKFDPGGGCLICPGEGFERQRSLDFAFNGLATSSACGLPSDGVYLSRQATPEDILRAFGPTPDPLACPPPPAAPEITAQYASSVGDDGATVRAQINPRFWSGSLGVTNYYVEYGTAECSKGGCSAEPAPPGAKLNAGAVNTAITSAGIFLAGLAPHTTYHFRFVAESTGGGPVYGLGDPEEATFEAGAEGTFTTYPEPLPAKPDCPNQAFRGGAAASLADCRAYELVSPVDKEGGDIVVFLNIANERAGLFQGSPDGSKLTYSSYRAFGAPESAPYTSQYIATRGGGGWSSEAIAAPGEGLSIPAERRGLDVPYKAFSADLCSGWFLQDTGLLLDPAAPVGFADLYRRDNCGGGGYGALNTAEPSLSAPSQFWMELQGFSGDGSCAVFRANDKLTPGASGEVSGGNGIYQLYRSCGGQMRLISVLPDGSASNLHSSAGTASGAKFYHRDQSVWRAVSEDGSRVYWTAAPGIGQAPGKVYVRENAGEDQSALVGGKCSEAGKACTYPVSETVSGADAQFWAADPAGSKALFTQGGSLYRFDFASKESTLIASGVAGLLGASDDLGRIYLASSEVLDAGASEGKPNLYLHEGEDFSFIATLSDVDGLNLNAVRSPINDEPSRRAARVSPDGKRAAFVSTASLTGYDNTDASSPTRCGEPQSRCDSEVFLYDAAANGGEGELRCVSCNPSGARPVGRAAETYLNGAATYWVAAQIPAWESQLYPERALSTDGSRLFFESYEALSLRDTNGKKDVYQWERAADEKACEDQGAELFVAGAGGCISLISSGESAEDSEFLDATPDGSDVFFATGASLLAQDPGLVDVYDARVNGGFPPLGPPKAPCEGEACQSPPAPPDAPTPSSSAFRGQGNPVAALNCSFAARKARKLTARAQRLRRAGRRAKSARATRLMQRKAGRAAKSAKRLNGKAKRCRARVRASRRAGR